MPPDPAAGWTRVGDVFDAVVDRPPAERPAALDRLCRDVDGRPDDALRAEVESLLAADAAADTGGLGPLDAADAAALVADAAVAGERIGPWRVVRELGRGGMGRVDLVERADGAYDQLAALKRLGLVASDRVRLFVRERQILARLDHPGIARLLDGGVGTEGTPYLVMEYVEGEPLTAYADAHDLSVDARIERFLQVCDAVGYAHRHLVVHRDLKPSNVFVTAEGGVKLLDFGIARLIDEAAEPSGGPETALPMLTPEYAAPEQVTGGVITTATDVYALGVVLYELLAGTRPYAIERSTLSGIVATVRDTEPPPPSAVASEGRRRALRGDLDTIVLKALAKDPAQRYGSADDLATDLRRLKRGDPVVARAPTVRYRARRFVGRHRLGVAATALVLLAAITGTAFYTARLAAERDRAEQAATRAERTADFLEGIFAGSDPTGAGHPDSLSARQLLDAGAAQARADLAEEPLVLAQMLGTIGRVYRAVGLYDASEPALRDAVALYASTGGDPLGHRDALLELANLEYRKEAYDPADHYARHALRLDSLHAAPDESERLAILNTIGLVLSDTGQLEEAARVVGDVVAGRRADGSEEARIDLGVNLGNLGLILIDLGRFDEAEAILDEGIALCEETRGPNHPYVAFALNSRVAIHQHRHDFDRAIADQQRSIAIGETALGVDHPFTDYARGNLASLLALRDSVGR
ncbi:protein kinase domain-containing protein [Rubrivirga sp. IMCC43871]|uniref:protein kinase domain-containing protein n=1 Tax=Rubrivirga sp. IMCC43871 TaxID=3391575 RepID=UPI00398FFFF9